MATSEVVPELKQIIGALIFGAERPLSVKEIRRCMIEVAETQGGLTAAFSTVKEDDIRQGLEDLGLELKRSQCGFELSEVAGGFRLQSAPSCGRWLRHLLDIGRPNRLSRPALETLAIIAYRQPVAKSDIEGIRGVGVDHIIKLLMEMQLVKIAGRSELPGRPFLYGTTQAFLEHFGLRDMKDLEKIDPMLAAAKMSLAKAAKAAKPAEPARGGGTEDGPELALEEGSEPSSAEPGNETPGPAADGTEPSEGAEAKGRKRKAAQVSASAPVDDCSDEEAEEDSGDDEELDEDIEDEDGDTEEVVDDDDEEDEEELVEDEEDEEDEDEDSSDDEMDGRR